MARVIRRFISLLFALGIYDKHYKIVYGGKIVSFNQLYSGGHWSKRSAIKTKFHEIFATLLLGAEVKPMKELFLIIFFNTRHDCDNIVLTAKFLLDTMKGVYIEDDTSKFYKGIQIVHDSELPKGQLEINLLGK